MNPEVAALYARIPKIQCQGKCQSYCGPVVQLGAYTEAERPDVESALRDAHIPQPAQLSTSCAALDQNGRCTIYASRPAICRLWGVAEGMAPCPHGCEPQRILTKAEANEILKALEAIAGPGAFISARELLRGS